MSGTHLAVAAAVGCAWTACGGTGHLVFANADWHLRDAVLHDLVTGRWPVGYGVLEGRDSLLRAPIGYYLPAALIGKWAGLLAAHAALAVWTAAGVVLFLMQVLSPTAPQPARHFRGARLRGAARLRGGSRRGGSRARRGQRASAARRARRGCRHRALQRTRRDRYLAAGAGICPLAHWDVTRHLEWWAESYQYSSMTTQLFWVPNHALGGWLVIGLLMRNRAARAAGAGREPRDRGIERGAAASRRCSPSWSWRWRSGRRSRRSEPRRSCCAGCATAMRRERSLALANPRIWAPALAVGLVLAAYLTLDAGRIPRGWTIGRHGLGAGAVARDLWRHAEFFLLEAGLIGAAILAIRRVAPGRARARDSRASAAGEFRRGQRFRHARLDSEPGGAGHRGLPRARRGRAERAGPHQARRCSRDCSCWARSRLSRSSRAPRSWSGGPSISTRRSSAPRAAAIRRTTWRICTGSGSPRYCGLLTRCRSDLWTPRPAQIPRCASRNRGGLR